ncbi:hypothetical protein COW36_08945 [bacterium (Candidatus Blackallbacteria) CG17_big_fil_post_rev_8_21_14_2_50_48_46]|uniref:Uncharacterized protein n=1 Tax=bacterium (Candidatus Blackallbacteria) CG17_big_fil_post_rev_8_21_14_2_50_48_46 TaxID=2014261 RepID=A0A2M7G5R2_9BACT|nr:MAG: hypothetical protein COW64_24105 [bacterium (Candidatus Blackallbacteria) CG18_big_fil_WC_8_21_14_2_50_49_26]PIW17295.1 MAG: hypothetical protein COW36_08945 [bacterium (Candidatus Blackallbacteria) CG17_big_fil_post_rev_8_21_14_2_50_48_46]PIW47474.1 MAG: hypothetical protein COW20_12885 [bacterium (Candidatus Blackallbacteria) CG13_big_fil_rev_8_21_14_2_50_49_14]
MQNTPSHLSPDDLACPDATRKKTIELTNSTPAHIHLPSNVKSFTLIASGPIYWRADFCSAVQENPGDLSDNAKDNVIPQDAGSVVWPNGDYINTISVMRQSAEAGTDTVIVIPGRGPDSGLEGITWDILPYAEEA